MSPVTLQVIATIAGTILACAGLATGVLRIGAWWVRKAIDEENQKLIDRLNGRYVNQAICNERHMMISLKET